MTGPILNLPSCQRKEMICKPVTGGTGTTVSDIALATLRVDLDPLCAGASGLENSATLNERHDASG